MNLRTMLALCLLSLPVAHMQAIPTLQDVDLLAGRVVNGFAGWIDNAGAYFNLCRAPIARATKNVLSEVAEHANNWDLEKAAQAMEKGIQHNTNPDLPYAPVTTFLNDHMTEAKIVLGCVVALVAAVATKKIFFPKKTKKNKVR